MIAVVVQDAGFLGCAGFLGQTQLAGLLAQFTEMLAYLPRHHAAPGLRLQGRKVVWPVIVVEAGCVFGCQRLFCLRRALLF